MKCRITPRKKWQLESSNNYSETDILEQQAISLYRHVKEISKMKYESELRREDSLIQQSSHMQTAFSFMTAALFMAAPVMIEYRGNKLSITFFLVVFSSIVLCLLISLVTASLAQRRVLKQTFMSIPEIEKFVSDTYADTLRESAQLKQWVQVVGDVQVDLQKVNDRRVIYIRASMISFFVSIAFIVIWYIIAISKLL